MTGSKYIDLHLHSNCSDGIHPPETVVRMAADAGISAVAICDHDNIAACQAALTAGRAAGIDVLSGVELSVVHDGIFDIHLLGYGFDPQHPQLVARLNEFQQFRQHRNAQIVDNINTRLRDHGHEPLNFDAVVSRAGGALGRPHIGRELIERGYAGSMEEAFQRYLVPCNVKKRFFPIDEAMALIHQAGGVAVLAHPAFIPIDDERFRHMLDNWVALGLDGVECHFGGVTRQRIDWYITEARRRKLLVTGGSDYHGDAGKKIGYCGMGNLRIPYACYEEVVAALGR
ncbi:MAG: PHP domain-containing protein [Desulfuromonadales bacterium]|nr:PHP domain-containing protein [Desulfuromonadales bacterium]MDT8424080.1 PHP domain-containing protein [Desulfuromonadales bacterium]